MYKVIATAKAQVATSNRPTLSREVTLDHEPTADDLKQIKNETATLYADVNRSSARIDLAIRKA